MPAHILLWEGILKFIDFVLLFVVIIDIIAKQIKIGIKYITHRFDIGIRDSDYIKYIYIKYITHRFDIHISSYKG